MSPISAPLPRQTAACAASISIWQAGELGRAAQQPHGLLMAQAVGRAAVEIDALLGDEADPSDPFRPQSSCALGRSLDATLAHIAAASASALAPIEKRRAERRHGGVLWWHSKHFRSVQL